MEDVYQVVPWAEFKERPDQPDSELLERWKAMPADVPRAFKSHASPGPFMDFHENVKYIVVARNPEEGLCSFHPFLKAHNPEMWKLWDAEHVKETMVREGFAEWFEECALEWSPTPPGVPKVPGGMLNVFYFSFVVHPPPGSPPSPPP